VIDLGDGVKTNAQLTFPAVGNGPWLFNILRLSIFFIIFYFTSFLVIAFTQKRIEADIQSIYLL